MIIIATRQIDDKYICCIFIPVVCCWICLCFVFVWCGFRWSWLGYMCLYWMWVLIACIVCAVDACLCVGGCVHCGGGVCELCFVWCVFMFCFWGYVRVVCVNAVKCINLCKYFVLFDNRGYHFCSVDCISILVLGINFCSHVDSKWVLYKVAKSQVLDFGCIAHLFESGLCQFLLLIIMSFYCSVYLNTV